MTEVPTTVDDACWPVDISACDAFATLSEPQRDIAKALAGQTMRMLTGYVVGGCPGTFRPCTVRCAAGSAGWHWSNGTFMPVNVSGRWVNVTCGCGWDCSHSLVGAITLPGHVTSVNSVKIDGVVVDPTLYRLVGNQLVRTDDQPWPATQLMSQPDTEVGTFSVTYSSGVPVDAVGAYAAGLLACEYGKALSGKTCALPKSVTNITRQGITMQLTPGAFPEGLTGVPFVDAYVARYNPHHLKMASEVWSPDMDGGTFQ